MKPLRTLREIAGKVAPGRPPAYTPAHTMIALEMIGEGLRIGRQQLSRALRLGEGTIRTMVGRMKDLGLIESTRGGMSLTYKGHETLEMLHEVISTSQIPQTSLTVDSKNCAVLVKDASSGVNLGIEQRDAALMAGAQGATTLIFDGEALHMPSTEEGLDAETSHIVLERFSPGEGDVIIIGSSGDIFSAEIGAKAAALELLERLSL